MYDQRAPPKKCSMYLKRLLNLEILAVEQELTRNINLNGIINDFAL